MNTVVLHLVARAVVVSTFATGWALAAAQVPPDTLQLRHDLATVLDGEFEIVRTDLSSNLSERQGTFWLVHARPLRSGDFQFRYQYRFRDRIRPEDPLYTHVEHSSVIRVGEEGCLRRREYRDVCLGDVIILPIVAEGDASHEFSLVWRPAPTFDTLEEDPTTAIPEEDASAHAAGAYLRYLGSRTDVMPHRNGGSTTDLTAEFEALTPGAFNIKVAPEPAANIPTPERESIPVLIVARGRAGNRAARKRIHQVLPRFRALRVAHGESVPNDAAGLSAGRPFLLAVPHLFGPRRQ